MEAEAFSELFGSPVNRALLNVFFLQDANKKQAGRPDAEPRPIKLAAVVGAGMMGQGIAAANVKAGIPVALGDVSAEAVGRGVQGISPKSASTKRHEGPTSRRRSSSRRWSTARSSDAELAAPTS